MKISDDKKLPFFCGCIISILIGLYNPIYGLYTGVTVGVGAEVENYLNYGLFDKYNILATWAGALIGTCLCMIAQNLKLCV